MENFSEFASENSFDGAKIKLENIMDKPLIVKDFRVTESKFDGKCLKLQVEINGENRVVFTGSNVLIEQSQKYKDHMPFSAKITMIDKYFSFEGA